MISRLQPANVRVLSLTTIATPHRGSAFADYLFRWIGATNLPHLYKALNYFGLETGAFEQLTMKYMAESFNPRTPDVDGIEYYSYGATLRPRLTSVFRKSHAVVQVEEGPNDGLVSVRSAKWGTYKGTLDDVSHLDLINWTNKLRWWVWELTGHRKQYVCYSCLPGLAELLIVLQLQCYCVLSRHSGFVQRDLDHVSHADCVLDMLAKEGL